MPIVMRMDPLDAIEKKATATKTIRITRTEAYAMRMAGPRKRKLTFTLAGLLIAIILGSLLWLWQDAWLPYWLEAVPAAAPAETTEAVPETPAPAPAPVAAPAAPVAETRPAEAPESGLDYLSAAVWDDPRFRHGVRRFNQAIDRHRQVRGQAKSEALAQIEEGAMQAGQVFEELRAEAPASVPIDDYISRTHRLVAETRRAARAAAPQPAPPPVTAELTAEAMRRHPDFLKGARLFNRALEQFNQFKADPGRTDLLQPTEELARQAGQTFEALKRTMPASLHKEIDRQIHQSYGIVSACRGAQLKDGGVRDPSTPGRGTTGPGRRPALPAYQPVP